MVDEAYCVKHIILYLRTAQPQTRACVHTTVNNALCNCIPRMPRLRAYVWVQLPDVFNFRCVCAVGGSGNGRRFIHSI